MRRFPEKDYILPELALRELQSAKDPSYRALTGNEFASERALHNEKGSLAGEFILILIL